MSTVREPEVQWSQDQMIEVRLREPDDFESLRDRLELVLHLVKRRAISVVSHPT